MTLPVLTVSNACYNWKTRSDFSLFVPEFNVGATEKVLLLGESGSGKSTLLSLICGTILPSSGSIRVAQTELATLSAAQRDTFRAANIGVIFQQFNLLPFATVSDNILLPLQFAPQRSKRISGGAQEEARSLCAQLGLPDGVLQAHANGLSVGQQQRVAVARALIGCPPLLIADEPTSALDANSQAVFLDLMFDRITAQNAALLMVSHDERLADRFDRVVHMTDITAHSGEPA
ncbi:MAG: ATP-binding cassette domain-containing protein [Pelagimonas sp.]